MCASYVRLMCFLRASCVLLACFLRASYVPLACLLRASCVLLEVGGVRVLGFLGFEA